MKQSQKEVRCPMCAEEMVYQGRHKFWKCYCGFELWPPTKEEPTWPHMKVQSKGGGSRNGRSRKAKPALVPWYQGYRE